MILPAGLSCWDSTWWCNFVVPAVGQRVLVPPDELDRASKRLEIVLTLGDAPTIKKGLIHPLQDIEPGLTPLL